MGRPLNKRLWGANSFNNIKVQFHNGTGSVPGYIVKQLSARRWKVRDADGNTSNCKLVAKASGNLLPGEMSITVKYDNGTASQINKIGTHIVTVNGTWQPWTFDPSTTDGRVQIEEAGTNTSLASNTDLEGDDIPAGLFDLPVPGSGTYNATFAGVMTSAGTPYNPGSNVGSITSETLGLWRKKYSGNFGTNPGSGIDVTFVRTTPGFFGKPDTYVSFGQQNVVTENYYTFEWVGYFKAPTTATYNFWAACDDDVYMWIGTNALGTNNTNSNFHLYSSNTTAKNTNSVTLTAGQYYPVRIQFGEYGGAENCQIFWGRTTDGTATAGNDGLSGTQVWYHNGTTKGH